VKARRARPGGVSGGREAGHFFFFFFLALFFFVRPSTRLALATIFSYALRESLPFFSCCFARPLSGADRWWRPPGSGRTRAGRHTTHGQTAGVLPRAPATSSIVSETTCATRPLRAPARRLPRPTQRAPSRASCGSPWPRTPRPRGLSGTRSCSPTAAPPASRGRSLRGRSTRRPMPAGSRDRGAKPRSRRRGSAAPARPGTRTRSPAAGA
jgi:hypothetical protein